MEIFPNVHEIRSVFGNRWVKQYLFVGDIVVLLDAGVAKTPAESIFPYMEKIGISPARLAIVVAMHADADHHGGLPAVKDASKNTLLACHRDDLTLIESPERLYQDRYNFLSREHGLGFGREGMVNCPEGRKIDMVLSGSESIQLAKDWALRFWHVPGHSAGHLAAYDEKNHAAFTSDAVQANGYPILPTERWLSARHITPWMRIWRLFNFWRMCRSSTCLPATGLPNTGHWFAHS
jgi:glyoxylase-like metal-dependent hydrolase (beta-lactamase superfamily II)